MTQGGGPIHTCAWGGQTRLWWTDAARPIADHLHRAYRGRKYWLDRLCIVSPAKVDSPFPTLVDAALVASGGKAAGWVMVLGTSSPYQKMICLTTTAAGTPLVVAKRACGTMASASMRREMAALEYWAGREHPGFAMPMPLKAQDSAVTVQSALAGTAITAWTEDQSQAWIQLMSREVPLSERHTAVCRRIDTLEHLAKISTDWQYGVTPALNLGRQLLRNPGLAELPWGMAHRDMARANMLQVGSDVGVIDWEWLDGNWTPAQDVLHSAQAQNGFDVPVDLQRLRKLCLGTTRNHGLALAMLYLDISTHYMTSALASDLTWHDGVCPAVRSGLQSLLQSTVAARVFT